MFKRPSTRLAAILTALISISACGGGGSGTPPGGTNPPPGGTTPPPGGNQAPTVTVAETDPAMELTTVTLTANGNDADGDTLAYTWTQTAGTPVELTGANSAAISFNAPKVKNSETLAFEVTVNDGEATASADLEVIIEEANGVVYSGIEEVARVDHVYFHHPALEKPRKLNPNIDTSSIELAGASPILLLPDHKHVAYVYSPRLKDGTFENRLYIAALDGSGETDITGNIVENGRISTVKLSPDGKWLAFTGYLETDETRELFVVPADGSMPRRKVSGDVIVENGDVSASHFYWSPDSTQLLFGGDIRIDGRNEVFVADIAANNPVLVSIEGEEANIDNFFTNVTGAPFSWSPDGDYIAFVEQTSATALIELIIASKDGNERRAVAILIPNDLEKLQFGWSKQEKLAFILSSANHEELYITTLEPEFSIKRVGGAHDIVDANNVPIGKALKFLWSPDGEHLAFILRASASKVGVFVVPADAESPDDRVRIDGQTEEDASVADFASAGSWLPDSQRFLFTKRIAGLIRLYVNNIENTLLTDISGEFSASTSGVSGNYCISPAGEHTIFNGDISGDDTSHLYRSRTDGTERSTITGTVTGEDGGAKPTTNFRNSDCWSPDGEHVLFTGNLERSDLEQLFVVPKNSVDGRDRIRVSNFLETDGDGNGSPDGRFTVAIWVGPDAK